MIPLAVFCSAGAGSIRTRSASGLNVDLFLEFLSLFTCPQFDQFYAIK